MTSKMMPEIIKKMHSPKTSFLQPLTHIIKVLGVPDVSIFDQDFMKKVVSECNSLENHNFKVPRHHFKVPRASQRRKVVAKAPKRVLMGSLGGIKIEPFFDLGPL